MARPPLIIVSPGIEKRGIEFHDLSISLSVKYEYAVLQAGGLPFTAPATIDRQMLAEAIRHADGVMLTGGDDIHPDLHGRRLPPAVRKTIGPTPDGGRRDLRELILIDEAFRQRKPLLAICRGHQLLNLALGGHLIADIRHEMPDALNHQRMDKAGELVHEVPLTSGSLLSKMVKKRVLGVNSSHHQGVLEPADPLVAVGRTQDGIVEAMELKPETARRMPFLLSVQFHPERLTERHAEHRAIFRQFVKACGRNYKS
jgi:putative glutamine amidotransferase